MKHREKLRMARKMLSKNELMRHVSIFQGKAWQERRENKETRVHNLVVASEWRKENKYDNKTA